MATVEAQLHLRRGSDGEKRPEDERRWREGGRERGAKEKEPADNPICSTELVMPNCSSTCFSHTHRHAHARTHTQLKVETGNQDFSNPI